MLVGLPRQTDNWRQLGKVGPINYCLVAMGRLNEWTWGVARLVSRQNCGVSKCSDGREPLLQNAGRQVRTGEKISIALPCGRGEVEQVVELVRTRLRSLC